MQEGHELVKRIFRKSTINKYMKKSIYVYDDYKEDVYSFLIIRLFFELVVFILSFLLSNYSLLAAVCITALANFLCGYIHYDAKIKRKEKILERDASFFFEILILSLKSGKNLLQAVELTCKNLDNDFSNLLELSLNDMKYGKSLLEVITDFKDKISSESIKSILLGIIDSYTTGSNMIDSIQKELDSLNEKRISDIKMYINKLPIKISVISVFLLIPLMLLIILSPVLIEYFG